MRIIKGLFGALSVVVGLLWLQATGLQVLGGTKADGRIVSVRRQPVRSNRLDAPAYFISFQFQDTKGLSHTISPGMPLQSYARYNRGDAVRVVYSSEFPESARIQAFDSLYLWPILVCILGASLFYSAFFGSRETRGL